MKNGKKYRMQLESFLTVVPQNPIIETYLSIVLDTRIRVWT